MDRMTSERAIELLLKDWEADGGLKWTHGFGEAIKMGAAALTAQRELLDALEGVAREAWGDSTAKCHRMEPTTGRQETLFAQLLKHNRVRQTESGSYEWVTP